MEKSSSNLDVRGLTSWAPPELLVRSFLHVVLKVGRVSEWTHALNSFDWALEPGKLN